MILPCPIIFTIMPQAYLRDPYDELSSEEQRMVDEMLTGRKVQGHGSFGTAVTLMAQEDQDSDTSYGQEAAIDVVPIRISNNSMTSFATRAMGEAKEDFQGLPKVHHDLKSLDIQSGDDSTATVDEEQGHDDCGDADSESSDNSVPRPVLPLEEDYETILAIVNDTPSAFSDNFDCDDAHEFTPFAVCAAEEREGLSVTDFKTLNEICDPSLAATSLSSGFLRRRLVVAKHSRFKRYLDILSSDPPPRSSKAFDTMRNLLLSIMNEPSARESVCLLNGLEAIVNSMTHFHDKARIQIVAVSVLGCLADEPKGPKATRRALIGQHCGVAHILRAMRTFSIKQNEMLFEEGCIALYKIVQHPMNAEQFGYNRGVRTLVRVMLALPTNLAVQKAALGVLLRTCHVNQDFVVKREVYDAVGATLKRHSGCVQLQRVGCLFWRQVVTLSDDANLDELLQCNVVMALLTCVRENAKEKELLQNAFCSLAILSRHKLQARLTIAQNGMAEVLKAIKVFQRDVVLQREAFKILRSLRQLPDKNLVLSKSLLEDHFVANIMVRARLHNAVLHKSRASRRKTIAKKRSSSTYAF